MSSLSKSDDMQLKSELPEEVDIISMNGVEGTGRSMYYDAEASKQLVRRFDRRLVPLACWTYLIAYIDRANIGNARVSGKASTDMASELHLSSEQYNIALVVFLVSYTVFGPPGNLCLKKFGPPTWIGFIMVIWGICTCCLGTVQTRGQLYAVRWLLGMAEASLFGGIVYVFTFYYRPEERSIRIALMLASATLGE